MAEQKTKPSNADVREYLQAVEPAVRREDALTLVELMERISGQTPRMWGDSMIGFGSYHYRYESGHEGDSFRVGFAPRKNALSVYIMPGYQDYAEILQRLGKHSKGKACLYLKKLSDVDLSVLEELIQRALRDMERMYPSGSADA